MLTAKRIALFGTGNLGKLVFAGAAALTYYETKQEKTQLDFDILTTTVYKDFSTLVKSYKKVQRKYYPEKDFLIKSKETKLL